MAPRHCWPMRMESTPCRPPGSTRSASISARLFTLARRASEGRVSLSSWLAPICALPVRHPEGERCSHREHNERDRLELQHTAEEIAERLIFDKRELAPFGKQAQRQSGDAGRDRHPDGTRFPEGG